MPPVKSKLYKVEIRGHEKPVFYVAENSEKAIENVLKKESIDREDIISVKMVENYTSNDYKIACIYGSRDEDDWF